MQREAFDQLVAKLEADARRAPGAYRTRVFLLAMLGNGYLAVMVLLLIALIAGLVASVMVLKALAIKLILVVGVFLYVVLRALWVKVPPPAGRPIAPAEAPALFALIDALRIALKAPRFHNVLMTDDFNAAVVQAPRLGVFGWPRNYLLIGLPLMQALTVEQFKAVLAHEYGHLAGGHGRWSNWIYRQRLRWSRLMDTLAATRSAGTFMFKPFLDWYAPYFNAYSFPLARANEYEADAAAARLTSPRAAASALTGVEVIAAYLHQRYWPGIHKLAEIEPRPGFMPFAGMGQRVSAELDADSTRGWLEQAMARRTTSADTHPALGDRLKAIGEAPVLAPPTANTGADSLLGAARAAIIEAFDRQWEEAIRPVWEQRHREVQEARKRLAELDRRVAAGTEIEPAEAYERAMLTEGVGNDADAGLAQLQALHARLPDNAVVTLAVGARLLGRDDAHGWPLVERSMVLDETLTVRACEVLRDACWRTGREAEAQAWHERLVARAELDQAAEQERSTLMTNDKFEAHGLPEEAVASLVASLRAIPNLARAYLVRKRVRHFPERPLYILGYVVARKGIFRNKERAAELAEEINREVQFPGHTLIMSVIGDNYRFGRKFRWMRGARIL